MNNNQNNAQNAVLPDNLNPTNPTVQPNNPSVNNENNNRFINNNVMDTEIKDLPNMQPMNQQPQQNVQQQQETSINSMNIKDNYNNLDKPGYVNDTQIVENMNNFSKKKTTIPITKELKTVIVITVILLIFIIIMPMLFDLISNLRFN